MRSALIFKNIREENALTLEDTARVLGQFISEELQLPTKCLRKTLVFI